MLYFDNLSPDTADAYLADGLTEGITVRLSQIERLSVVSRTAVRRYRGRASDPATLGSALGVGYLVNGSVRLTAHRMRVTVELVRVSNGVLVWGEQYDRTDADVLAIEEDIARAVVRTVVGKLLPREGASLAALPTRSRQAYDHYLRGTFELARRTMDPPAVLRAFKEFETATRLDPRFARAHARIGITAGFLLAPRFNPGLPRDSLLARGLAAAARALELDSSISDAWVARGWLLAQSESQFHPEVLAAYERAITLDPQNAEAHHLYGVALAIELGDVKRALPVLERAVALDPGHPTYLLVLAVTTSATRRFADAQRWCDSALAVAPGTALAFSARSGIRLALGDTAGAWTDADTAERLLPTWTWSSAVKALIEIGRGDTLVALGTAKRLMGEVETPDAPRGLSVAAILTALGDHTGAVDYLERVRPRQGRWLPLFLTYVWLDPLRADPRFHRLVEESRPR